MARRANIDPKTHGSQLMLVWLREARMDQTEFAAKHAIHLGHFNHILHGRRGLSLDVAVKIEKATKGKVPPRSWLEPIQETETAAA